MRLWWVVSVGLFAALPLDWSSCRSSSETEDHRIHFKAFADQPIYSVTCPSLPQTPVYINLNHNGIYITPLCYNKTNIFVPDCINNHNFSRDSSQWNHLCLHPFCNLFADIESNAHSSFFCEYGLKNYTNKSLSANVTRSRAQLLTCCVGDGCLGVLEKDPDDGATNSNNGVCKGKGSFVDIAIRRETGKLLPLLTPKTCARNCSSQGRFAACDSKDHLVLYQCNITNTGALFRAYDLVPSHRQYSYRCEVSTDSDKCSSALSNITVNEGHTGEEDGSQSNHVVTITISVSCVVIVIIVIVILVYVWRNRSSIANLTRHSLYQVSRNCDEPCSPDEIVPL